MLKRIFLFGFVLIFVVAGAFTLDMAAIEEADALYEDDEPQAAFDILEDTLSTAENGAERSEVLWRLARAILDVGELEEDKGGPDGPILTIYLAGEQYGVQAVDADPSNHLAYYWQSANIGKWGQLRGILNSLFKAGPMRQLLNQAIVHEPDHADTYYILGQMYEQVPGWPFWGNKDFAVSLGRKSIVLHEAELAAGIEEEMNHDYYVQMAGHLIARNWNENKRNSEQSKKRRNYDNTDEVLRRGWYYEGMVEISAQSDREEAEALLRRMIGSLESISDRSDSQNRQLDEAREIMADL